MEFHRTFAAALGDPSRPVPPGVIAPGGRVDPARFAVYRNNVAVGLSNALAARFPVVLKLVGEEFFRAMAQVYVAGHKPTSPLLMTYGDGLPAFVAGFPPAASVPYLADVARLEIAWSEAYHAAEAEPLRPADLVALVDGDLDEVVLAPHPATRLLASTWPVGSIWAAQASEPPGTVDRWDAETALVTRPDAEVMVTVLPPEDAAFASALMGGASLAAAAETAFAAAPGFDFGRALVGLVGLGAFRRPGA